MKQPSSFRAKREDMRGAKGGRALFRSPKIRLAAAAVDLAAEDSWEHVCCGPDICDSPFPGSYVML